MLGQMIGAVALATGMFGLTLAGFMLVPMAVDIFDGNPDWQAFLLSAASVGIISRFVVLASWGQRATYSRRLGFLIVNALWIASTLIAALPYMVSGAGLSFTDAVFESISGLTTTGSTILVGLDTMPRGLLLWRSLTQGFGGIGILAMGLILFPFLRIGGMQIYRLESSQQAENPVAQFQTFALDLLLLYVFLIGACTVGYQLTGMNLFDAINHALTTVSTGGFSTHDTSMIRFDRGVHLVAIVFMFAGALPFVALLRGILSRDIRKAYDPQIPALLGIVAVLSLLAFIAGSANRESDAVDVAVASVFNVVSVITTTGYSSTNYLGWGPFAIAIFTVTTFLGGCAGSTAGGIKPYRLILAWRSLHMAINELLYPNGVFAVRYHGKQVPERTLRSVSVFLAAFFSALLIGTLVLAATGLDFVTAFSGALTALTNTGPGASDLIGPVGNFSTLPGLAKWTLSVLMLLGRLEIMTMLVLVSPLFWRS